MPTGYQHQLCPPPTGMATAVERSALPLERAAYLRGFYPARQGRMVPVHRPKDISTTTWEHRGYAVWHSPDGASDLLLAIDETGKLWKSGIGTGSLGSGSAEGEPYTYLSPPVWTQVTVGVYTTAVSAGANYLRSVQYKHELYCFTDQGMFRFTNISGTAKFYPIGLPQASTPTLGAVGAGVLTGAYSYKWVPLDEQDRPGSPSASVTTPVLTDNSQIVNYVGTWGDGNGVYQAALYRQNPGSTTYNYVATIVLASATSYLDNIADAVVAAGEACPEPGQNDAPNAATLGEVWGSRLVLNDTSDPHGIQISNADAPTQFASFSAATDTPADGLRIPVGSDRGDEVTGLVSLGAMCVVFKRRSRHALGGQDNATFYVEDMPGGGCINPDGVLRGEGAALYLSNDGLHAVGYAGGFETVDMSAEVRDVLLGFGATTRPPTGQAADTVTFQAGMTAPGRVRMWAMDRRLYLSVVDRTYVYDLMERGWSDTGWGLVRAHVSVHTANVPPTTFLSFGATLTFGLTMAYFKADDTGREPQGLTPQNERQRDYKAGVIVSRPYDGDRNDPHGRVKAARRWRLWGHCNASVRAGSILGTVTFRTDRGLARSVPIRASLRGIEPGLLCEIQPPAGIVGRDIWTEERYADPVGHGLVRGDAMLQYDVVGK